MPCSLSAWFARRKQFKLCRLAYELVILERAPRGFSDVQGTPEVSDGATASNPSLPRMSLSHAWCKRCGASYQELFKAPFEPWSIAEHDNNISGPEGLLNSEDSTTRVNEQWKGLPALSVEEVARCEVDMTQDGEVSRIMQGTLTHILSLININLA